MKIHLIAGLVLLACGCNEKNAPAPVASNNQPVVTQAPPPESKPLESNVEQSNVEQPKGDEPGAKSPEELVENFKAAFASGDSAAIKKMVHWEGNEASRDMMVKFELSTEMTGDSHLSEATLRPATASDQSPFQSKPPTHILQYKVSANDGRGYKSNSVPILQIKDKYYFYLAAPK